MWCINSVKRVCFQIDNKNLSYRLGIADVITVHKYAIVHRILKEKREQMYDETAGRVENQILHYMNTHLRPYWCITILSQSTKIWISNLIIFFFIDLNTSIRRTHNYTLCNDVQKKYLKYTLSFSILQIKFTCCIAAKFYEYIMSQMHKYLMKNKLIIAK